jgi:hypothetical protein
MHLNRLNILLAAVILGCSQTTEPVHLKGTYRLNDIDGRTLPTPPAFTPGLTPTILSSEVALHDDGTATVTDHRIEWNGVHNVLTYWYTYTISGLDISFVVPPCPPDAICAWDNSVDISGKILGDNLSLIRGYVNEDPIVYHYHS